LPRPTRVQVEGGIYHLVSRGVRKLPIFTDDLSRERFLGLLDATTARYRWELHTYCLMTNHFHLLVTTVDPTVSAGMQYLNSCYAQWFDWKWSSYRATVGATYDGPRLSLWLISQFGRNLQEARERFAVFIRAGE